MKDETKTKEELKKELQQLRIQVSKQDNSKPEQKDAEETLHQYEHIVYNSTDMLAILDKQFVYLAANKAYTKAFNLPHEQVIGNTVANLFGEEFFNTVIKPNANRCLGGEEVSYQDWFYFPAYGQCYMDITYHPYYSDNNKIVGFVASSRNITEQKKAYEELQFRVKMLDNATDSITVSDLDGNMVYVNETACLARGYSKEEFLRMNTHELIIPEHAGQFNERVKEIMAKGHIIFDTEIYHKNGSVIPVEMHSRIMEVDGRKLVLNVIRDITERKQIEEKLAASEVRYRRLFETAQDAILILDGDTGQIIDANPFIKDILGFSMEELMGKNLWEIGELKDTLASKLSCKQLHECGYIRYDNLPLVAKDKRRIPVEIVANAYQVDHQRVIQCNIRDITVRKRMETEKVEMELKSQVASRLASVGEMASGIAHEINNPLTGVVGFAQLLVDREDLPEDVREQLKIINEGGKRVANIIKKLLSFAQQSKPKRAYIDINEVVKGTLQLSHYELETGNIEVIKQFDTDLPWTMADAGQLQQVFINLMINAEYEMSSAHGKGRLEIKTELAGDMIHVSFKDDGPGIPIKNIGKIFNPFFTTKETGKGTGLGLSLSHGIIAEHGGQLYAESEPGEGATFVVELPVLAEEVEVEEAKVTDETGEVIKGKILVVDDEELVRQYLNSILGKMGHTVEMASDGKKALEMVKSTSYNLILSDMKMPGMGGKEFYRKIEEIAPSISRRVVFITGDVMGEDTHDFIQKTGALYVTKPFDAGRLCWLVNRCLVVQKE